MKVGGEVYFDLLHDFVERFFGAPHQCQLCFGGGLIDVSQLVARQKFALYAHHTFGYAFDVDAQSARGVQNDGGVTTCVCDTYLVRAVGDVGLACRFVGYGLFLAEHLVEHDAHGQIFQTAFLGGELRRFGYDERIQIQQVE